MTYLYYDTKTGNVRRFINKVVQITGWQAIQIDKDMIIEEPGHLVTFTTKIGSVPLTTEEFAANNALNLFSVSSSGNRNWGKYFAVAADQLTAHYGIPLALRFELSGTMEDINQFIDIIKNQYYDSKRGSKKLDIA